MTDFERKKIADVLAAKINAASDPPCLPLNQVSPTLQAEGIDTGLYGGLGPKRFLLLYFREFIILGGNGTETVWLSSNPEAQALKKVSAALEAKIRIDGSILFSNIPDFLVQQCDVNYQLYSQGRRLQQWLLSRLLNFERSQDGLALQLRGSQPVAGEGTTMAMEETRQMHAIAFMNLWPTNACQLQQYNSFDGMEPNDLRNVVAHNMAIALLQPEGHLLLETETESPRFAFDSGLKTKEGNLLYCVLRPNPKNVDGTKQFWCLEGFCYPGEQRADGLGIWLSEKLSSSKMAYTGPDPEALRNQVAELRSQRDELQVQLKAYLSDMEAEQKPQVALHEQIAEYEDLWQSVTDALSRFPSLRMTTPLTLSSLDTQLQQMDLSADLRAQLQELFHVVTNAVLALYSANHLLNESETSTPSQDIAKFAECCAVPPLDQAALRQLMEPYRNLLTVMQASRPQDVEDQIDIVRNHFEEFTYRFITNGLVRSEPGDYEPLLQLDRMEGLLNQITALSQGNEGTRQERNCPPTEEELLQLATGSRQDWLINWIRDVGAVLPADPMEKALVCNDRDTIAAMNPAVVQSLEGVNQALSPMGAAARLKAAVGSWNETAKKYLLLGTLYDQERCVPALLQIYRQEERRDAFEALWAAYGQQLNLNPVDAACWLVFRCLDAADDTNLTELENYLNQHSELLSNNNIRPYLDQLAPQPQRPAAFWAWLHAPALTLNEFETSVRNNDLGRMYALLDAPDTMSSMGYDETERSAMRQLLQQPLPVGADTYSAALRLYTVQENKNNSAEKLFWEASGQPKAAQALFNIYAQRKDAASILWLVQHFHLVPAEGSAQMQLYIKALMDGGSREELSNFARQHPTLWHECDLLRTLAAQSTPDQGRPDWRALMKWELANPAVPLCNFEQAVLRGERMAAEQYLSQEEAMSGWGYDAAALEQVRHALEQLSTAWEPSDRDGAVRLQTIQGNLHRAAERILHQCLATDFDWACRQLFDLLFAQQRWQEAACYYEAYPLLQTGEQNSARYMWCLVHLQEYERLQECADKIPHCLQWDPALADQVLSIAKELGNKEFAAQVHHSLKLLPRNRFEESLINGDTTAMQQLIGSPSQLIELGYTHDEINHFKDSLSKPYASGNSGFAIGSRIRSFLGDERAEQFLLDSEEDSRSARALFDIYTKQNRWDDLCRLYRRHSEVDTWNPHYRRFYILALSKATEPESCRLFLNFVNDEQNGIDKNNAEVQWLYLRAMLGAGYTLDEAAEQCEVLTGHPPFKPALADSIFDLLWKDGSDDARQKAVLLAGRLLKAYEGQLDLESKKKLVSVNGHLLEEDHQTWIAFLRENQQEELLWLLDCCFHYSFGGSPEADGQLYGRLVERLAESSGSQGELELYAEFLSGGAIPEQTENALADALLNAWEAALNPQKPDCAQAWAGFSRNMEPLMRTQDQCQRVEQMWCNALDQTDEPAAQQTLLACGVQLLTVAKARTLDMPAVADRLADGWIDLMESGQALEPLSWKALTDFWSHCALRPEQLARLDDALAERRQRIHTPGASFFQRIAWLMDTPNGGMQPYRPSFMDQLVDDFSTWLHTDNLASSEETKAAANFLQCQALEYDQMKQLIGAMGEADLFANQTLANAVQQRCTEWPDLAYDCKKQECLRMDRDDPRRTELLQQLLDLAAPLVTSHTFGHDDLQLLYEAACLNLTVESLHLLQLAYHQAGADDMADILQGLVDGDWHDGNPDRLISWFQTMLENHSVEWLARYSRWWAPLVRPATEDASVKVMVNYLGLTGPAVDSSYLQAVTRLLLANLNDPDYLKCFLRIAGDFSDSARAKLKYIEAENDPEQADTVIRQYIDSKQYLLAANLLLHKLETPQSNSSTAGQMIGALYTEETLKACPELKEKIPAIFSAIQQLNQSDPQGSWKNIGRAVDIACLAGCETHLFTQMGQTMLQEYPGKCAALIANMVQRGEVQEAKTWLDRVRAYSNHAYLALLDHVITSCQQEQTLSPTNALLVRSIPRDGNHRPLDAYGELVNYAFSRDWQKECVQAFYQLYQFDKNDKALAACCIQLYMANPEAVGLETLYNTMQEYLSLVQESYLVRAAYGLVVVGSCLPEKVGTVTTCLKYLSAQDNSDVIKDLLKLESQCRNFLAAESDDLKFRRELLVRAATGWWKMDHTTIELITPWRELFNLLVGIYPVAFVAACYRAAVAYPADKGYRDQLSDLLKEISNPDLSLCAIRLDCVVGIEPMRIPVMEKLLECPVELPWLYPRLIENVLKNTDRDQVEKELWLLCSIQPNFTYSHYQNNLYHLKEQVEHQYPQYRTLFSELLIRMSTEGSREGSLEAPGTYLTIGDYPMVYKAAVSRLAEMTQEPQTGRRHYREVLYETYRQLAQLMMEQLTETEESNIHLNEFMNMANVLCQTDSYQDIQKLMDLCIAKWKICIRCVQEMIQGQPSNVLYVLQRRNFRRHEFCYAHVCRMVRMYVSARGGQGQLIEENKRCNRGERWGCIKPSDVPQDNLNCGFLLGINCRHTVDLPSFRNEINELLKEMDQEDSYNNDRGNIDSPKVQPAEIQAAYRSFHSIPFAIEQVVRWQNENPVPMQDQDEAELPRQDKERLRNELMEKLRQAKTDSERIDCYGQLLALDWDTDGSATTCWCCAELGVRLYEAQCKKQNGLIVQATPKARRILYDMAACLPGLPRNSALSGRIRTALQQSLVSYETLADLISDCSQPYLLTLCNAITDDKARSGLIQHVNDVRNIGVKMSSPMTIKERLDWLKQCVTDCQDRRNPFNAEPNQKLCLLLNQQIVQLQGMAQVVLEVYNNTGTIEEGHLFGKIENLGAQSVRNVRMELRINGIVAKQYSLSQLEGKSMVPFSLSYVTEEDADSLTYSLVASYRTDDTQEDQSVQTEGSLTLQDPDDLDYDYTLYKVDTPANEKNYATRVHIQKVLDSLFGEEQHFEDMPNLAIYGMRRVGKSSVLRNLERMLDARSGDQTVYWAETSGEGVRGALYERVHSVLVQQVLRALSRHLRQKEGWEEFCEKWNNLPVETLSQNWDWLDDFYTDLDQIWLDNTGLVILVDEVEGMYLDPKAGNYQPTEEESEDAALYPAGTYEKTPSDIDLWNCMSRISQRNHAVVRFVLCGSDFFINKLLEGDNLTQFFQRIKKLSIGRMERMELEQALRITERGSSLKLHPDTIEYLWRAVGGLPWHAKLIINAAIEKLLIGKEDCSRDVLYPSDILWGVDSALHNSLVSTDPNFGLVALSADERMILEPLTRELRTPSTWVLDSQLRQAFHQTVGDESWESRYSQAIKALLTERQMLARSRSNHEEQYQFGCELYRLYNRRETPDQFTIR